MHLHCHHPDDPIPATVERCTALMARFYRARLGLGDEFADTTRRSLADFVAGFDAERDALWLAMHDGRIAGCGAVDGRPGERPAPGTALFRWLYLAPECRGHGLGHELLRRAIRFARDAGYAALALHTHATLEAAVRLYERHGFRRAGEHRGVHWGRELTLLGYRLELTAAAAARRAALAALATA